MHMVEFAPSNQDFVGLRPLSSRFIRLMNQLIRFIAGGRDMQVLVDYDFIHDCDKINVFAYIAI